MTQLPLRLAPGVVLWRGHVHADGPFAAGAAEQTRREAARQRRPSTREAMLRSAAWIEEWTRMHNPESGR